jgi:uncharacterized protein (DUF362 family)/NAD-dependent dihydropyrimidine dehydrogenase PreA subunit
MKSRVVLLRCESYEETGVYETVRRGLELLGGLESVIHIDERVLFKVNNLASSKPEEAVTTHPEVFKAVARVFKEQGYQKLAYGDSPGFEKPAQSLAKSGFARVAEELQIPQGDFDTGRRIDFPEGKAWNSFDIATAVLESDALVSLSKMKTHALARITGAVKNQFGCVYGLNKAAFHVKLPTGTQFSRMLVDLNRLLKPRLFIMDGIVAMEGNGPRGGTPRPMNCLLFSTDPVALDATFCRLINLEPSYVPTIFYGKEYGLGTYLEDEIELVGDPLASFMAPDFDVVRKPLHLKSDNGNHTLVPQAVLTLGKHATQRWSPRPHIVAQKCIKCGICVDACPVEGKALQFKTGKRREPPIYDYSKCIRCFCCQEMCPQKAIEVETPLLYRLFGKK